MNPEIQKLAPEIWREIEKANNILLHFHVYPDGDSIGSALGLYHALTASGKKVSVIRGDSPTPPAFRLVPGLDQVLPQTFGETNLADFDLFIILDSAAPNRVTAIGEVKFPERLQTIVIDHHVGNPRYGQINLVVSDYPATAQIIYDLLNLWSVEINEKSAACLFLGLYTDTGGFRYQATTGDTLRAAADLRDKAPSVWQVIFELENNLSPEILRFDGLALSRVETFGGLAVSTIAYADLEAHNLAGALLSTGHIAQVLKQVVGWDIGAFIVEAKPGEVKLSTRTRDAAKYNLSEIVQPLGGGGHRAAAGAIMTGVTAEEAKAKLLAVVRQLHPDLLKS